MKISEMAKKFNISIDTLRYYEKIGLLSNIPKDSSGNRNYDEESEKALNFILCMKKTSLSLDEIRKFQKLYEEGKHTIFERKQILLQQKDVVIKEIESLKNVLNYLEAKIEYYNNEVKK